MTGGRAAPAVTMSRVIHLPNVLVLGILSS